MQKRLAASRLRVGSETPHPAQVEADSGEAPPDPCDQIMRLVTSGVAEERLAPIPRRAFMTARAIASARVSPLPVESRSRRSAKTIQNVQYQIPSISSSEQGMSCISRRRRSRFAAFSLVEYGGVFFFASPFNLRSMRRSSSGPASFTMGTVNVTTGAERVGTNAYLFRKSLCAAAHRGGRGVSAVGS